MSQQIETTMPWSPPFGGPPQVAELVLDSSVQVCDFVFDCPSWIVSRKLAAQRLNGRKRWPGCSTNA